MNTQRGSIGFNIMFAIMLVAIGVMLYILLGGKNPFVTSTNTVVSPATIVDETTPSRDANGEFNDGLGAADAATAGELDEYGAGIAVIDVFNRDINSDGRIDRITRTRVENGTDHFYYEYKLELNTQNGYMDITPDGFRTTEGAECALRKLRFIFRPAFRVDIISREWTDTWITPTMATKTTYAFRHGELNASDATQMRVVCDVADLF